MGEVLAVGFDGFLIGLRGCEITVPVGGAGLRGLSKKAVEIVVDAADHVGGEVSGLGERLGAWQDGRGGVGEGEAGEEQGEERAGFAGRAEKGVGAEHGEVGWVGGGLAGWW